MSDEGKVFRALGDDSRRAMLGLLSKKPRTSTELGAPFAMTASAISQHLAVLREAGLVEVERVGKYRVYKLSPQPLRDAAEWMVHLEAQWTERLDRLDKVVTRLQRDRDEGRRGRS